MTSTSSNVLSFARFHESSGVVVVSNLGTQSVNTSLSLPASTLVPGTYYVTDLYTDQYLGTVSINADGGFEDWQSSTTGLGARATRILSLSPDSPVSTFDLGRATVDFLLYPNPATHAIHIRSDMKSLQNGVVTITTANGIPVYNAVMVGDTFTVHTGDWPQGVYFVQIVVDGNIGIKRLVVM